MRDRVGGRAIGGAAFDQARGGPGARGLGGAGSAVHGCDRRLAFGHLGTSLRRVERIPAEAEAAEDLDADNGKSDHGDRDQDPVRRREAGDVLGVHQG